MKSWLEKNAIEMYWTQDEGKSVVAERFIGTLKNKIDNYITPISKSIYVDKLDDIANKCNNKYHRTIEIKPVNVKSNTCINFSKEIIDQDLDFKTGDIVRISKCKKLLVKVYVTNWSEEVFTIKKDKSTVPWTYVISDLKGEEIIGTFYKKELPKKKKKFRPEKVIKKKVDKLYVKWKVCDSFFNSLIDQKHIV